MESSCDRLRTVITRDIEGVKDQLLAYQNEADIWACPPGVSNSSGTLALHLAGNLRALIGAKVGGTDYVRDRDGEFERRDVPRADLLAELDRAKADVDRTLRGIMDTDLEVPFEFPPQFGDLNVSVGMFLTHLATHLTYHVGQMDYHRRLVTGASDSVNLLSIKALSN